MTEETKKILASLESSLQDGSFIKLSLGNYKGSEENLKSIHLKRISIKKEEKLSFTYRYQTKDITKNHTFAEAIGLLGGLIGMAGFRLATLFSLRANITLEFGKDEKASLKTQQATLKEVPALEHDKAKNRKITPAGKHYLQELGITDEAGNVFKNAQDKFRQINHYIEILSGLLKELPQRPLTKIADMGAGKGYLTFALYDYLNNTLRKPASIVGVEARKDLVELCNGIAKKSGFENLSFAEGHIGDYETEAGLNVLIALHACDTATDDAIFKGIAGGAALIVVAPCCHKQIRREMEKHKSANALEDLLKHGIFLERQAEMLTDGLRALLLEHSGYATKVFEFVSDAHTPKNVMIVGIKKEVSAAAQQEILVKIKNLKAFFGVENQRLETLLGL